MWTSQQPIVFAGDLWIAMLHQPFQIGAEVSLQILQINAEVLLLFVLCKQFAMWVWLKKTVSDLLIIFFNYITTIILYYYYRRSTRVFAFSWRRPRCKQPRPKNQRSRNSYAGFRPQRSPARPKPWYNFCMSSQICQLHLVTLFNLAPYCEDACNTVLRMP